MTTYHLTINLLGTALLDLEIGRAEPPATTADAEQHDSADAGPVTDRRANPMLGFSTAKTGLRRAALGERPVIR